MQDIEMHEMSREFLPIWQAAGMHLDRQVDGGIQFWLRAHPYPPVLEHLSFRLGNQLFFIRVEDDDGEVEGPGSLRGLFAIAEGCEGHPCRMPMKHSRSGWVPAELGWGLVHARTGRAIEPAMLVTDERIEMTAWELQDLAVQVVRTDLEQEGRQLMSWQGHPEVDPSIWFVGDSGPEWVMVRATTSPSDEAVRPDNLDEIRNRCAASGKTGHFASVAVVSAEEPLNPDSKSPNPLWRGHAMYIGYHGLQPIDE